MANTNTYVTRPAQPAIPKPEAPEPKLQPQGYWPGLHEEKFHVLRFDNIMLDDRERGAYREYKVLGLKGWCSGPRAGKLNISRKWTLRLLRVDDKLLVEGEVLLYPANSRIVGAEDPRRGVVVTIPLSGPEEDREVRRLKRSVFRLAAWAGERLAVGFEKYLEDQGL